MQRARTMDGRPEDGLRHGLPSGPTHRDTLRAARGAHRHLQRHKLRAHDPAQHPATAAATSPRAPSAATPTTRARPPTATRAARARADAGARRAAGRAAAEAAEERQEEAAAPRPVRPRATTAAAAAATAATPGAAATTTTGATSAGARAEQQPGQGQRPAVVLEVHAVAAAEVGGDAEAARVLLRGVPVQLPDAGARGHLQHGHRRQQAHHHLQRGEPQRLRHRLSARLGRPSEWEGGENPVPSSLVGDKRKVGWYGALR